MKTDKLYSRLASEAKQATEGKPNVRNIDIVFVIDATYSMAKLFDGAKDAVRKLRDALIDVMAVYNEEIGTFRVRLIAFRDYGEDDNPMDCSRFYELPEEEGLWNKRFDSIVPQGGGDSAEDGFEALYLAMRSDFVTGNRDRQVIVLITDADATPMGEHRGQPGYPADMGTLEDLFETWMGCRSADPSLKLLYRNERLVMFAPKGSLYEELSTLLERTVFFPIDPVNGFKEVEFDIIAKLIIGG